MTGLRRSVNFLLNDTRQERRHFRRTCQTSNHPRRFRCVFYC